MDDLPLFTPKEISHGKIGRPIASLTQKWTENFSKEMSTF